MARATKHVNDPEKWATRVKPELLHILAALPARKQAEVLDFARILQQQMTQEPTEAHGESPDIVLRTAPARSMYELTGLVTLGGDALADSEAVYNAGPDRD